ncbi:MAG: hypothetical protein MI975_26915 [Cytophagales bacterium]|nr:hypothetical protein [Cytophagales bacterium]
MVSKALRCIEMHWLDGLKTGRSGRTIFECVFIVHAVRDHLMDIGIKMSAYGLTGSQRTEIEWVRDEIFALNQVNPGVARTGLDPGRCFIPVHSDDIFTSIKVFFKPNIYT